MDFFQCEKLLKVCSLTLRLMLKVVNKFSKISLQLCSPGTCGAPLILSFHQLELQIFLSADSYCSGRKLQCQPNAILGPDQLNLI